MASHIERRKFLATLGAASAWPLAARAQQPAMPRVAVLMPYAESDSLAQTWLTAFMQAMQAVGWTDGRNIRVDVRWAGGCVSANSKGPSCNARPDHTLGHPTWF